MVEEMKLVGYNVDTLSTNVRRKNRDGKLSSEGIDEKRSHEAYSPLRVKQEGANMKGGSAGTGYWNED